MREMKDSGIEWVWEIPKFWDACLMKRLVTIGSGGTPTDNPSNWNGSIPWVTPADFDTTQHYIHAGRRCLSQSGFDSCAATIVPEGSIIFSKRAPIGKVVICDQPVSTNQGCLTCIPNPSCDVNYLYYFIATATEEYELRGSGTTFKEISSAEFGRTKIVVPSLEEQNAIANHLDSKCSQIDSIIEKTQQEIEKLKEYRQSIITEAVTKGLDPNVEMKDSGIEWIGMVPKKWGTPKICYLATVSSGGTPDRNNSRYWQGDIPWIKTGELLNERISQTEEYITEEGLQNSSAKVYLPETILIAMYGQGKTRGMTGMLDIEAATNQACAAIQVNNPSMNNEFLWNVMIGAYDAIRSIAFGSGQPNLNAEIIKHFFVPMPPIEEQIEIVKYLSSKREAVDSTLEAKRKIISRLQQYKKSLIYECVTGKKEVTSNA